MSVPNQKHIITKKEPCDKSNIYSITNIEAMKSAMKDLKGECFKLWSYFSKNQNNFQFDLSYKELEQWGIAKSTYYESFKKLVEKGYLQRKNEHSNIYFFTETAFSEIWKEPTEKEYIISEIQKDNSGNRNEFSDFRQRNNTDTLQKNTIKKSGKAANNLDDACIDVLREIETDYNNGKFNQEQQRIVNNLSFYIKSNCEIETTDNLYDEILSAYTKLYVK